MAIEIDLRTWRAGFVCDTCHRPIAVAGSGTDGSGIVIFKNEDRLSTEFLIVHKGRCDRRELGEKNTRTCWLPLEEFLDELKDSLKVKAATAA